MMRGMARRPSPDFRERLAAAVDAGLPPGEAATRFRVSVRSVYRWQGAVQDEAESLLIIKTTRSRFDALEAGVLDVHPYSVPEVIALPVVAGHAPYLGWVSQMTDEGSG